MPRNPYKALRALVPDPPLLVGTVVGVADGTATIEMPGGGLEQARGAASPGDRVFFRGGAIEGPAPELPIVLIEV
jgi:hypothetical protein